MGRNWLLKSRRLSLIAPAARIVRSARCAIPSSVRAPRISFPSFSFSSYIRASTLP